MTTPAQRAASAKYDRANTKQLSIKLNTRTDSAIIDHLAEQSNVQGYIKRLIIEDMHRSNEDRFMEERLRTHIADGTATVSYSSAYSPSSAFFDVSDMLVERWLQMRFGATQTALSEKTWVVECGDGQSYDRIIMPMLDRLLAE